jgi:hypothetical protein
MVVRARLRKGMKSCRVQHDTAERGYGDIQVYDVSPWLDRCPGDGHDLRLG